MRAIVDKSRGVLPEAARNLFPHVDEIAVTDEHPSNLAAEAAIHASLEGTNGLVMHVLCDVHKASAVAEKTLSGLVEPVISGCIQVALAMRVGQYGAFAPFVVALSA